MKYLLVCLLIVQFEIALPQAIKNQSISGIITDVVTGIPIELANVFLSNSSIGDVSDKDGYYEINNIPLGRYDLIVSVIGYEKETVKISITRTVNVTINLALERQIIELPDVTVSANPWLRKRQLRKFVKNFLGNSLNGKDTEILNTDVIHFNADESGVLKAYAYDPIEIENNSLGYKIYYVLDEFEMGSWFVRYTGYPHFTELIPNTTKDSIKWTDNRVLTYKGSMRHFLTTICNNYKNTQADMDERDFSFDWGDMIKHKVKVTYTDSSLIEYQGFYTLQVENPFTKNRNAERQLVNTNWFLTPAEESHEMYLKFDGYLEVRYDDELYPFNNLIEKNKRTSWITLSKDSTILDKLGCYFDKYAIQTSGIWSKERVADMLPYDYKIIE